MIEGELTLWVGGDVIVAPAGSFVFGPRDIPHTFVISSAVARFLMVTDSAPFADFVRAGSEPAQALTLAPASVQPPSPEELTAIAAEYGIEVLGPRYPRLSSTLHGWSASIHGRGAFACISQ